MRWAKVPCGKNDNHDLSNGVVICLSHSFHAELHAATLEVYADDAYIDVLVELYFF